MDYKRIITSRRFRIKILSFLAWLPNRLMLLLQYHIYMNRKLDLVHPKRFTEKIQLYKLKYRIPAMLQCTDKYEVRKYIKDQKLENILIPLIGVYSKVEEIDFDSLPNCFVAKTTDGGGNNQVLLCKNKDSLNNKLFVNKLNLWLKAPKPKKPIGREWAYENGYPRRIVIEQLLREEGDKELIDYKFWCFNGEPRYCQVIGGRSEIETIDFFDMNWIHQPFRGLNRACRNAIITPKKPIRFEEMKDIARKLSNAFPFVRVDLYEVSNKIYFGELTFYPASGYGGFTPDSYDYELGSYLNI